MTEPVAQRHNPDVDAWLEKTTNPQKELMKLVRDVILGADERMTETVKWSCPTFGYEGNLVSIQPNAKKFVGLMFHRGSEIPNVQHLLEGDAALARMMRFGDADDLEKKRGDLEAVVRAWCEWKAS